MPYTDINVKRQKCLESYHKKMKDPKWYTENRQRHREGEVRRKYGLSSEQYRQMVKDQQDSCAICHTKFEYTSRQTSPCVDHSHTTGQVRALLCYPCNSGLGMFKDNFELLKEAATYLENHAPSRNP